MAGIDENTLLLLNGETLIDTSFYNIPITNNGVQISTAQAKFGNSSMYFGGSQFLTFQNLIFILGTSDFTIDWWEYCISPEIRFSINSLNTAGYSNLYVGYNKTGIYSTTEVGSWNVLSQSNAFPTNVNNIWNHFALVRNGNVLILYKNGVNSFEYDSFSPNFVNGDGLCFIGTNRLSDNKFFTGYIDEFRVSNVARWTSNFTPPTEPYSVSPNMYVKINNVWQPVTGIYTKTNNTW